MVRLRVSDLLKKQYALVLICFFVAFGLSNPSYAVDPACDFAFLQKLKDRAWAEAQREMMHNKQMIWKPDSVFVLGCVDKWIGNVPVSFQNGSSGSDQITKLKDGIGEYLTASFSTQFLGGGNATAGNPTQRNVCASIQTLWNAALCLNLNTTQIQTFDNASANDPRLKPMACNNTGGLWGAASAVITSAGAGAGFDSMSLFSSVVAPLSELKSQKCSKGIPTGVMLSGGSNKEIVCPNPGCTPTGGATPQCCKTGTTSGPSCQ